QVCRIAVWPPPEAIHKSAAKYAGKEGRKEGERAGQARLTGAPGSLQHEPRNRDRSQRAADQRDRGRGDQRVDGSALSLDHRARARSESRSAWAKRAELPPVWTNTTVSSGLTSPVRIWSSRPDIAFPV